MLKQQSDYTYILEMYKDDRKSDAKGAIFLDLAQEVVRVSSHDDAPWNFATFDPRMENVRSLTTDSVSTNKGVN